MKGTIRNYGGDCPVCGEAFERMMHPVYGDVFDIMCVRCKTVPKKFYVDGRQFRNRHGYVGNIFRNDHGELFYSFLEAKRLLEAVRADWDKDSQRFDPSKWAKAGKEALTVSACAREWILFLEQNPKRSKRYALAVQIKFTNHINPMPFGEKTFGEQDVRDLVPEDFEKLQLHLIGKGLKQRTVKTAMAYLRTLLIRVRDRKQKISTVPVFPEGWSHVDRTERYTASPEVQEAIKRRMPVSTHLMMDVLYATGMRPGEVCGLKAGDLTADGRIYIQRSIDYDRNPGPPKNGKPRYTKHLPQELYVRLKSIPALPDAYLFRTMRNNQIFHGGILSRLFIIATRKAGYPQLTLTTSERHSIISTTVREAEARAIKEATEVAGNTAKILKENYLQDESMVVRIKEG